MKRSLWVSLALFIFWLTSITYVNYHSISISRNIINGELDIEYPGIHISPPWVQTSNLDIRPFKACVDCGCRSLNCKLISFNPKSWKSFVMREGFKYYWWSNRISFNMGYENEYRGIHSILRGYAFSDTKDEFIVINSEYIQR